MGKSFRYQLMFALFLVLAITTRNSFAYELYTSDGSKTTSYTVLSLSGDKVAQRFVAPESFDKNPPCFDTLKINISTFGQTGRGCTMKLYQWSTDYATTIASAPVAVEVFTNIIDNSWVEFYCGVQNPGDYLLVVSDPTGGDIAAWAYDYSHKSDGIAFKNSSEIVTGDITAFTPDGSTPESLQSCGTAAQDFYGDGFDTLKFRVFTFLETADSFEMSLYKWLVDFDRTVDQTPLATKSYSYGEVSDNETVEWNMGTSFGAGHYLLVMSNAGGANIGWWRYQNSTWMSDTYTAFTGGTGTTGDEEMWIGPSKTVDLCVQIHNLVEPFFYDGEILEADPTVTIHPHSYAPAHLFHEGKHKMWWCDWSNHHYPWQDAIWYAEKTGDLSDTGGWSTPVMVHNINNITWGEFHTADPEIITGNFTYNSNSYTYALYFTSVIDLGVEDYVNRIGLSFSNDGQNFTASTPDPVITPDGPHTPPAYETGMSGMSWDPVANKYVHAVFDSTVGNLVTRRYSDDGIVWTAPGINTKINEIGRSNGGQGPDIAYNHHDQHWYAVVKCPDSSAVYDGETRVARSVDKDDLLSDWQLLKIIDKSITGNRGNHNPGLGKNQDGSLYIDDQGYMYVFFGTGTGFEGDATVRVGQTRLHVEARPADLNADDLTDLLDFGILTNSWLDTTCGGPDWCQYSDITQNGQVDLNDFEQMVADWLDPVTAPEPIAHWKMDETAGLIAVDSSRFGHDGSLVNFPGDNSQWVPGQVSGALLTDGASEYVNIDSFVFPTLDKTQGTIAAWIQIDPSHISDGSAHGLIEFGSTGTTDFVIALRKIGDGTLRLRYRIDSSNYDAVISDISSFDNFQHVAAVWTTNKIKIYLNGQLQDEQDKDGVFWNTLNMGRIGRTAQGSFATYANAKFDDIYIFNKPLMRAQILNLMQ